MDSKAAVRYAIKKMRIKTKRRRHVTATTWVTRCPSLQGPKTARRAVLSRPKYDAIVAAADGASSSLRVVKNAAALDDDHRGVSRFDATTTSVSSPSVSSSRRTIMAYAELGALGINDNVGSGSTAGMEAELDNAVALESSSIDQEGENLGSAHGRVRSVDDGGGVRWTRRALSDPSAAWLNGLLRGDERSSNKDGPIVVLRGVPGSGKSALAKMIARAARRDDGIDHDNDEADATAGAVLCSADLFFERGAGVLNRRERKGLTRDEVYARCFDTRRLADAHAYCRAQFDAALAHACRPLVIVDNTHTRLYEYDAYARAAEGARRTLIIIELDPSACGDDKSDESTNTGNVSESLLAPRSRHTVPAAVVARMRARWEPDARAVRLCPWIGDEAAASDVTLGQRDAPVAQPAAAPTSTPTISCWLAARRVAHHSKTRAKTHLVMEACGASAHFL